MMPMSLDKERKVMMRKDEHGEISSLSSTDKANEDGSILFHTFTAPECDFIFSTSSSFRASQHR